MDDRLFDFPCSSTFRRFEDELLGNESRQRPTVNQERIEAVRIRAVRDRTLDFRMRGKDESGQY